MDEWEKTDTLEKVLKLTSNLNATNMHIFNEKGVLQKMETPNDILITFYSIRTKYNKLRKKYLENKIEKELLVLESKVRFVRAIVNEELIIFKRKKNDILEDMKKMKLYENPDYDYLIKMPIFTFTEETIEKVEKEYAEKKQELKDIKAKTVKDIWREDLNKFE